MTNEQPPTSLARIRAAITVCESCELVRFATRAVPGEGDPHARIMLIGEAPGQNEDEQGRPFVGRSGSFLTELLHKAGLTREDVFITNVVKHRPPGNRDPLPDEMAACAHFLNAQIRAIDPDVIVTLGRFSMNRFFPGARISKIHGQPKEIDGRLIIPMYHPAAALRNGSLRPEMEADFLQLPRLLAERDQQRDAAKQQSLSMTQGTLF